MGVKLGLIALREQHGLMFEKKVLGKIVVPERNGIA
jgi:hypothetical protein